jgi:hypothetical protein
VVAELHGWERAQRRGAEVFTYTTTFQIMQSLRLDSGPSGPVHP